MIYLLSLAVSFFTLGLDISLNYYLSRREITTVTARYLILAAVLLALVCSLPLMAYFFASDRYARISPGEVLLFSGLYIAGGLLTSLSGALFTAFGKNHIPARVVFVSNALLAVSVLLYDRYGVVAHLPRVLFLFYFIFFFGSGLFLFFYSFRLRSAASPGSTAGARSRWPAAPGFRNFFRFSFLAFTINFTFFVGARFCLYGIPYYLSQADQGNYIQTYKLVEYLCLATSFLYYPFMALVAGQGKEEMKDRLRLLVRISNLLVLLFSIILLATGRWLFPFVFGDSFDRMYPLFLFFIPGLFAASASGFFTAWYFGSGHLRYNFISAGIQFLSMLAGFFILIRPWGARGAAAAFSLSTVLSLTYDLLVFRKLTACRFRDFLPAGPADWKRLAGLARRLLYAS